MAVYILITAAGSSSRMRGADKLMQIVDGVPLIRRQVARARAASPLVGVTLPASHPDRAAAIAGLDVMENVLPDAAEGMAASLRHAARSAPIFAGDLAVTAIMVVPADMPDITTDDMRQMIDAHRASPTAILRGTAENGNAGHPVLFPRALWPAMLMLQGDQGARPILARHAGRVVNVALPGNNALTDLDTPEDWAKWSAARRD